MGRKSIAPIRQNEILEAFERCIGKYGFTQSSTRRIADEAGINQPMIAHYFGSKKALVMALVDRVLKRIQLGLAETVKNNEGEKRLSLALDFVFGPGILGDEANGDNLGQLLAASKQDKELRSLMHTMYKTFFKMCEDELIRAFPETPQKTCKRVAYGVMCLIVGNDVVLSVELPHSNRKLARMCAEQLMFILKT